jgi:hypothetical protein
VISNFSINPFLATPTSSLRDRAKKNKQTKEGGQHHMTARHNDESIDDTFPSKFMKAADLPETGSMAVTICEVEIDAIGKTKERKPILTFEDHDKLFIANKTNCNTIGKITGSRKYKDWIGTTIYLYRAEVEYQGEMVESTRIKLKPDKAAETAAVPF